ncbi:DUF2304 domain-containing protein [Neobacillus massiliamazoniensis]|uniref:DUF2304 domain-containing protein n=1 Tax=Neobacillus massiliamazoniensis TaxID=1499688 RepID=A0A0U1P3U4_9BACI|nr:DUF2304 domain-containing protein [Neobacillus massiliamazoniensis]CRK84910.1 hypothetical protein BN000_04969 [Neobacillus massiliamazoniensis]
MISAQLQIILLITSIITLLVILNMIRKYNLELKYSLLWLFFCVVNILLAAFSDISKTIAGLLSIKQPVNAIFLLSFGFQFFLIFSLTITISRQSNKFTQLVQEVGLLKKEVEKLKDIKSTER